MNAFENIYHTEVDAFLHTHCLFTVVEAYF